MSWRRDLDQLQPEYRKAKVRAAPFSFAASVVMAVGLMIFALVVGEPDLALWVGGLTVVMTVLFVLVWRAGAARRRRLLGDERHPLDQMMGSGT